MTAHLLLCLLTVVRALAVVNEVSVVPRNAVADGPRLPSCRLVTNRGTATTTSISTTSTPTTVSTDNTSSTSTSSVSTTTSSNTSTTSTSNTVTISSTSSQSVSSTLTTTSLTSSPTTTPLTPTVTTSSNTQTAASSTTAPAQPLESSFKIQVQVNSAKRYTSVTLYVQFQGNDAYLVEDESQASTFTIVNGYLMYGNEYVTSGTSGYSSFSLSTDQPSQPGEWSLSNGQLSLRAAQGFCTASDGSLVIVIDQQPPFSCTTVSLVEDAAPQPSSSYGSSQSGTATQVGITGKPGQWTTGPTTTRSTTTTISCTPSVYTATTRCSCRWSVRCNSNAVSEFGYQPDTSIASSYTDCIELCNSNIYCSGVQYDPGSSTCYTWNQPGDNVLYGYNTGPWFAASPIDCDSSCAVSISKMTTTSTTTAPAPAQTGCHYEEYQAKGGCDCVWPIKCGTQVDTTPDTQVVLSNYHDCVDLCDSTSKCQLFTYDPADSTCRLWNDGDQPAVYSEGVYWCARLDNWCDSSKCPS